MNRKLTVIVALALALSVAVGAGTNRAGAAPSHPVRKGAIAFSAYSKIYAIQPNGSGLRVLVPARRRTCVDPSRQLCRISEFSWSRDGQRLAFLYGSAYTATFDTSLFQIGADGHGERRIPGCGRPWPSCRDFSWSPDGTQIVVSRYDGLFVVNAVEGSVRQLTRSRRDSWPRWSPDGSRIAFVRAPIFGKAGVRVISPTVGTTAERLPGTAGAVSSLQWSPDGSSVVYQHGSRLFRAPVDGSRLPAELAHINDGYNPSLSPDGRRVAFDSDVVEHKGTSRADPWTGRAEIWTMRADGTRRWRVYAGPVTADYLALHPVWSPDGRRVAFADDALYVVGANGNHHLRKLSSLAHESLSIGAEVAWQPLP